MGCIMCRHKAVNTFFCFYFAAPTFSVYPLGQVVTCGGKEWGTKGAHKDGNKSNKNTVQKVPRKKSLTWRNIKSNKNCKEKKLKGASRAKHRVQLRQ